jgi:transposase
VAVKDIVERVGVSKPTVIGWKKRYAAEGVGGLADRPKPGRRRVVDEVAVVLATLEPPPERLGITHWSSRLLARELGISHVWMSKIWGRWGLQPWRAETFKFSTDPELEAKVRDVVGLYLNPPDKAVVLCVDEKSPAPSLTRSSTTRSSTPPASSRGAAPHRLLITASRRSVTVPSKPVLRRRSRTTGGGRRAVEDLGRGRPRVSRPDGRR